MIFRNLPDLVAAVRRDETECRRLWGGRPWRLALASGHFDPLHSAHLDYLRESAQLGTCLVVVVNSDVSTCKKKGWRFLTDEDRSRIVSDLSYVDHVLVWDGEDLCAVIESLRPDVFANGGDRSDPGQMHPGEVEACARVKCTLATGVGGAVKRRSSSEIVRKAVKTLTEHPDWISSGCRLSVCTWANQK